MSLTLQEDPSFKTFWSHISDLRFSQKIALRTTTKIASEVAAAIVNKTIQNNQALHEKLAHEPFLIDHILDSLKNNGDIDLKEYSGGLKRIYNISPNLKRTLGF